MCIQVKRKLSSIRVAEPLTSVDLNRDGSTLALGDTRGQVWIYDLRATQQPLHLQKSAAGGREGGPTSSVSFLSPEFASSSYFPLDGRGENFFPRCANAASSGNFPSDLFYDQN